MPEEKRLPHGAVAVVGGIPIYTKPDLMPGHMEIRDRYGLIISVIRGVASISLRGDGKE